MIQMPWTEETFPFFLCKIWNKRQPKNTSLKQFLCPFDNENWKETYQFGYVGGPLFMLTSTWPHKNHWKLFDGSRDLKKNVLKGSCNMHYDIAEMPHLLKMSFQELKDVPRASALPRPWCPQDLACFHTWANLSLLSSCSSATWFTLSKVLHGPMLPSIACNWLKSMYVGYVSNELKVCSPWEYLWHFFVVVQ